MKNLSQLHPTHNEVSAQSLFKGEMGTATAIQLQLNGTLKEHITKTPAMLLCIHGKVNYKDETNQDFMLQSGDYVLITPNVKHWLHAAEQSQLVLLK